jgi:hypothetical protein
MNISVDKAGDLKLGRKKCRLYKRDEVVKVAKKYGIRDTEKLSVRELCGGIKMRASIPTNNYETLREAKKKRAKNANTNNIPLAKLYPAATKKMAAAKKRAEKKALDRKVAANFMKGMVTKRITTPMRSTVRAVMPMPKPQKKAQPLTKDEAKKRIMAMKGLTGRNKFVLVNRVNLNQHSPRRVVRLARELARLR